MKFLLGAAAVAALSIASPAMAQTDLASTVAACGTIEAAPSDPPDGATATREAMEAYTQRFNAWAAAGTAVMSCKRTHLEQARAALDALAAEFNTQTGARNTTIEAWTAEVAEFNARAPARPERRGR